MTPYCYNYNDKSNTSDKEKATFPLCAHAHVQGNLCIYMYFLCAFFVQTSTAFIQWFQSFGVAVVQVTEHSIGDPACIFFGFAVSQC